MAGVDLTFDTYAAAERYAQQRQDDGGGRPYRASRHVGNWAVVLYYGHLKVLHSSEFPEDAYRKELGANFQILHHCVNGPNAWQPPQEMLIQWQEEEYRQLMRQAHRLYLDLHRLYFAAADDYLKSPQIHDEALSKRSERLRVVQARARDRYQRRYDAFHAWEMARLEAADRARDEEGEPHDR